MNNVKINKISKYALSLIAVAALSCSSLSFGMDIFAAIEKNDTSRVKEILQDKGFDVNKADNTGSTPLLLACYNNNLDIVTLLLANGAQESINIADNDGETPLYKACWKNNKDIVTLLLANGAQESVNKANKYGETPLHLACYNNNLDIATLLLDKGAKESINIANKIGYTPLYWALLNYDKNTKDIVELLLSNGANVNQDSLRLATHNKTAGKPEILELLKKTKK